MPIECVAWLTTGTGASGIIINLARMACLVIFGDEQDGDSAVTNGTIAYFCVSGLIILSVIFMHYKFVQTKFFKYHWNLSFIE
jgi:hypothetical protein